MNDRKIKKITQQDGLIIFVKIILKIFYMNLFDFEK